MQRIKIPIPLISDLVDGFPKGGVIVIAGVPGVGKSVFINQTIINCLNRKDYAVFYIAIDTPIEEFLEFIKDRGIDVETILGNRLYIVNGFIVELRSLSRSKVYPVVNPMKPLETLDVLYELLSKARDKENVLIIDSINEFLMRNEPGLAIDFIKGLKLICKKTNSICIASLHLGIQGLEQLYSSIEYLVDGYIEVGFDKKLEELGIPLRRLRVRKMRNTSHELQWIPFTITREGKIEIVDIKKIISTIRANLAELKSLSIE